MNKMEELTKAELQIIQILWNIGKTLLILSFGQSGGLYGTVYE